MRYARIYYYNQYSPNRVFRRWLSRLIYDWANNKYGVKARGDISRGFSAKQNVMLEKWHYWMDVKNYIFWKRTLPDRVAEYLL